MGMESQDDPVASSSSELVYQAVRMKRHYLVNEQYLAEKGIVMQFPEVMKWRAQ